MTICRRLTDLDIPDDEPIGDPWDIALAEAFFASREKELLRRERFATHEHARMRIFWYVECFYNTRRRHSSLGYISPADYEHRHQHHQAAIAAERPGVNANGSTPRVQASPPERAE